MDGGLFTWDLEGYFMNFGSYSDGLRQRSDLDQHFSRDTLIRVENRLGDGVRESGTNGSILSS